MEKARFRNSQSALSPNKYHSSTKKRKIPPESRPSNTFSRNSAGLDRSLNAGRSQRTLGQTDLLEDLVGALDGDFDHTDPKNFLEIQSNNSLKGGATYVTNARKEKVDNFNN